MSRAVLAAFPRRRTVAEDALAALRDAILTGSLGPGDVLAEARLAAQFAVSRAPVREALAELGREGLVEFDRRGSARVVELMPEDVAELVLLRVTIEPVAARLACGRLGPADRDRLEDNLRQTRAARRLADVSRLDLEFHRAVLVAAGNRRLLSAWEALQFQVLLCLSRYLRTVEVKTRHVRELVVTSHAGLLATLVDGPPRRAEAAARAHVGDWLEEVRQVAPGHAPPGEVR